MFSYQISSIIHVCQFSETSADETASTSLPILTSRAYKNGQTYKAFSSRDSLILLVRAFRPHTFKNHHPSNK